MGWVSILPQAHGRCILRRLLIAVLLVSPCASLGCRLLNQKTERNHDRYDLGVIRVEIEVRGLGLWSSHLDNHSGVLQKISFVVRISQRRQKFENNRWRKGFLNFPPLLRGCKHLLHAYRLLLKTQLRQIPPSAYDSLRTGRREGARPSRH